MAVDKLVDSTQLDADLTSVANAIRTKGGTSSQLAFPAGFVSAVQAIPTGVTPTGTKNISITANGQTTEDVTAYASAQITANVPNTYAAADEGKVVSNGALVAQGSDTVTQNDTYDTTLISSLTVNVSGGGGGNAAFQLKDWKPYNAKWLLRESIPNVLIDGGCIHFKMTREAATFSQDAHIIAVGSDDLSNWTTASNCLMIFLHYPAGNDKLVLRLRGSALNGTIDLGALFEDTNNLIEIKLYKDKVVNVLTGVTTFYASDTETYSALATAMTNLCTHSYISVGNNQGTNARYTQSIVSLFAVEPS